MSKIALINGETERACIEQAGAVSIREAVRLVCGADEFSVPTVALLNGQPVLRRDGGWENAVVGQDEILLFVELPLGGGGGSARNALMLVVTAVAAVATWYIGGAGALAVGGYFAAGSASAYALGAVVGSAIMMVGSLVINSTTAQGKISAEAAEAASPTYSLNASGNMARIGQPEGECFGRMMIVPDYVAQPYIEYDANAQYGYFVYGLGRGSYQLEALYFGDTAFWRNGDFVAGSPYAADDGPEYSRVVNVNLPIGGSWSSAVAAVASGSVAGSFTVTVHCPDGYGLKKEVEPQHDHGRPKITWTAQPCTIQIQYAEMDDSGTVTGSWSSTVSKTFSAGTGNAFSRSFSIRPGAVKRWAVRVKNGSSTISAPAPPDVYTTYSAVQTVVFQKVSSSECSVRIQQVEPGGQVTLFPDNIVTSSEVSGLELFAPNDESYSDWAGPYAANGSGTQTDLIKVDYAYQNGLGRYNAKGGLDVFAVHVQVQAREIDDAGSAIGSWTTLGEWEDSAATQTPQRITRSFHVALGRYEVRMRRTSDTFRGDASPSLDSLVWTGLRAVLPGSLTYPQSVLAVKIKASDVLSQQASRQFRVIETRKLPTYNPATHAWSAAAAPTRSWAAAVSAACQADWGGGMADTDIDLDTLWRIDAELAALDWYFDAYIDGSYSMWQLLTEMCQCMLVVPRMIGWTLSFVRDLPGRSPSYELNARNIIRGSFSVIYNTWSDSTPDDVVVNYLDADYGFQSRDVQATLPNSESLAPVTLDWIGITNRTHAFRVATAYAARNRWRRVTVTCQIEALGRLINVGDVVSVNHPRFRNTSAGVVTAVASNSLTIDLQPDFEAAGVTPTHISLVQPDGSVWGPVRCSVNNNRATLNSSDYAAYILQSHPAPSSFFSDGSNGQPTTYALHTSSNFQRRMLVQSVVADDLWHYTLTLVNDADEVDDYDALPVPAWNGRQQTSETVLAAPTGLRADVAGSAVVVSWHAVPGANQYEVQHSEDGSLWVHDGLISSPQITIAGLGTMTVDIEDIDAEDFDIDAVQGNMLVRVAAIAEGRRSEWAYYQTEF